MSAIAGVYLLNGDSVDEKDLKRMNDSMPHRGPDGSGLWHDGSVGLAHQMLWTTPESLHEKLPFEADGLVITSDSRIDNREELLPELGLSEAVSDSEVILKAYGRWGKSCVYRLLGDFAFVIWDKAKEEMFCARDHMGVKPFFYFYKSEEIFAFATEIKSLLAWGVPPCINDARIGDYIMGVQEDKEITFYHEILRLPPASIISINHKTSHKEQYWKPDITREIWLDSDEEYEKIFLDIFKEAVRCRLRSAFNVGSMLSGGLDSSSIVCMANELLSGNNYLKTFSIIFDIVNECDERNYINCVIKKCRLDQHLIHGDRIGPFTNIENMLYHEDQPFFGCNLFLNWAVYKEAQKQDIRILLDGIGGDTTVSHGFAYITELAKNKRVVSLLKEAKGLSQNFNISISNLLFKRALCPFIPDQLIQLWNVLHDNESQSTKMVNSNFKNRIGLIMRRKALMKWRKNMSMTAKEDHWRSLSWGVLPIILEETNMAASSFRIESTHPFFDKRLVEFCLALPANQKIHCGWTRWIMRRALKEILPKEIYYRGSKSNLSPNFLYGLLEFHKAAIEKEITAGNCILDKYINMVELEGAYSRLSLKGIHSGVDEVSIWRIINLSFWLRRINQ